MLDLRVGMKIYDNAWFLRFGLSPEAAADRLAAMGVTFVIAQSKLLPMASSAVPNEADAEEAARLAALDDRAFREALRRRGIGYVACLNIGFDPVFAAAHPELLPIDQFGEPMRRQDWYIGLGPDCRPNIAHKTGLLAAAVRALDPDGVHLGFVRWPGFWETWLPDVDRRAMPDYSYAAATLRRFAEDTGCDLPVGDPVTAAGHIAGRHREAWRAWKCAVTAAMIGGIRTTLRGVKPNLPVAINTLPFHPGEFDNAVEAVFGQAVPDLVPVVDVFEVMAYHQILRRGPDWPARIASDIKRRSGNATICTVQADALYLSGMHAGRGRATEIGAAEFVAMVDAVERSPVDGLCLFTFTDFLERQDSAAGRAKADRIRRFRA